MGLYKVLSVWGLMFFSVAVNSLEKPKSPLEFDYYDEYNKYSKNIDYFCLLGTVYFKYEIVELDGEQKSAASSPLWNGEKSRPYKCDEFEKEIKNVLQEYDERMKKYNELKPTRVPLHRQMR